MPSRTLDRIPSAASIETLLGVTALPAPIRGRAEGVGAILQALELDPVIVRAGMALPVIGTAGFEIEHLDDRLGKETADLVRAALALPDLDTGGHGDESLSPVQAENLRKLLLAVVRDGRVMVIRLAERLHALRGAKSLSPTEQQGLAAATRSIYAPLANRL